MDFHSGPTIPAFRLLVTMLRNQATTKTPPWSRMLHFARSEGLLGGWAEAEIQQFCDGRGAWTGSVPCSFVHILRYTSGPRFRLGCCGYWAIQGIACALLQGRIRVSSHRKESVCRTIRSGSIQERLCKMVMRDIWLKTFRYGWSLGPVSQNYLIFFCGVGLTSPGTAATCGLLYSPRW
jgi:hypothetical protein